MEPSPQQAHRLWLQQPILSLADMLLFRKMVTEPAVDTTSLVSQVYKWRVRLFETSFELSPARHETRNDLGCLLKAKLDELCVAAEKAVREDGVSLIIISDRRVGLNTVPVPSLLAVGAVHQYLLRHELRMKCGLIIESGEAR